MIRKLYAAFLDRFICQHGILRFYHQQEYHSPYGTDSIRWPVDESRFYELLEESLMKEWEPSLFISTRLEDGRFVAMLDVDTEDGLVATLVSLDRKGICYEVVESSPGHKWLITNFVGPIDDVLNLMQNTPGVDEKFVDMCVEIRKVFIRATFDQNASPPRFLSNGESFKKDTAAQEWFRNLREHFNGLESYYYDTRLKLALQNGKLHDYLADPHSKK
jgi:hypothetical protein